MKVWVLRHGEAQNHADTDAQRELTDRGRAQVLHSAAHLAGVPLDAILASPYVRAQQTAALVHQALDFGKPLITVPWLTPEQSADGAATQLASLAFEHILLVSHQPLVGGLIGLLSSSEHPMGTASLAELEGEWALPGLMTLITLRHP